MVHETLGHPVLHLEYVVDVHLASSLDLLEHHGDRQRAQLGEHLERGLSEWCLGFLEALDHIDCGVKLEQVLDLLMIWDLRGRAGCYL